MTARDDINLFMNKESSIVGMQVGDLLWIWVARRMPAAGARRCVLTHTTS